MKNANKQITVKLEAENQLGFSAGVQAFTMTAEIKKSHLCGQPEMLVVKFVNVDGFEVATGDKKVFVSLVKKHFNVAIENKKQAWMSNELTILLGE